MFIFDNMKIVRTSTYHIFRKNPSEGNLHLRQLKDLLNDDDNQQIKEKTEWKKQHQ